jgi:hypothetical protein
VLGLVSLVSLVDFPIHRAYVGGNRCRSFISFSKDSWVKITFLLRVGFYFLRINEYGLPFADQNKAPF